MPYEENDYSALGDERPGLLARLVRLNRYLFALLILPISMFSLWPPRNEEQKQRQGVETLLKSREALRQEVAYRRHRLELIKNDTDYLEAMARDRLQLQKDGETIVRFDKE